MACGFGGEPFLDLVRLRSQLLWFLWDLLADLLRLTAKICYLHLLRRLLFRRLRRPASMQQPSVGFHPYHGETGKCPRRLQHVPQP